MAESIVWKGKEH